MTNLCTRFFLKKVENTTKLKALSKSSFFPKPEKISLKSENYISTSKFHRKKEGKQPTAASRDVKYVLQQAHKVIQSAFVFSLYATSHIPKRD